MSNTLLENRWQLYIGILTETTQTKNQRWFHVFIPEMLPLKTGDVTIEDGKQTIAIKNVLTGKTEESNINITATIYADYFGICSSLDVPTMYRGQQVLVMNYGTGDKWYWLPLERDDSYKTFEHIRISCADEAKTNKTTGVKDDIEARDKGLTDDNTYYIEVDTKYQKHIKISTSSSDGEAFRYFFEIDADVHTVELWDNCVDGTQPNNTIKIESRPDPATKGKITIQNASNNSIIMQGEDTMINVPRNLIVNIGGDTQINQVGNVAQTIGMAFTRIVNGLESTTNVGPADHKFMNDVVEFYKTNLNETIVQVHTEQQNVRTTTAVTSATFTTPSWSVKVLTGIFNIDVASWTGMNINFILSQVWSVTCNAWQATARAVGGAVVNLIRGGHH